MQFRFELENIPAVHFLSLSFLFPCFLYLFIRRVCIPFWSSFRFVFSGRSPMIPWLATKGSNYLNLLDYIHCCILNRIEHTLPSRYNSIWWLGVLFQCRRLFTLFFPHSPSSHPLDCCFSSIIFDFPIFHTMSPNWLLLFFYHLKLKQNEKVERKKEYRLWTHTIGAYFYALELVVPIKNCMRRWDACRAHNFGEFNAFGSRVHRLIVNKY